MQRLNEDKLIQTEILTFFDKHAYLCRFLLGTFGIVCLLIKCGSNDLTPLHPQVRGGDFHLAVKVTTLITICGKIFSPQMLRS